MQYRSVNPRTVFFNQFKSYLTIILLVAVLISCIVGEIVDSIVILFIVVLNAVL
jgi:Ca2+-transporting ATPase